ncbi:MAG: DcrB-related protein [Rhodothermales bacterium]
MELYEGWRDKTVYVIAGPATDGIQHNITVVAEPDQVAETVLEFAELYIGALEDQLQGCRLLLKDELQLASGSPACRSIFVWYPTDSLQLYQQQLYV